MRPFFSQWLGRGLVRKEKPRIRLDRFVLLVIKIITVFSLMLLVLALAYMAGQHVFGDRYKEARLF